MKKGSWGRCAEDRAEWHCKNNRHLQGHHFCGSAVLEGGGLFETIVWWEL